MKALLESTTDYFRGLWGAWNQFWFAPTDPSTLCLLRLLTGAMLLYTHIVWSKDLGAFFGPEGWLPQEVIDASHSERLLPNGNPRWVFSYFDFLGDGALLRVIHIVNLIVFFCMMIGLFSRVTAVLAAFSAIAYASHVTPGAFFGLDKINCMLALYVMLGPCGARYSIDRLWALRKESTGRGPAPTPPSISANVALRLIQIHMCIIYLFSGLGKLGGQMWSNGAATWFSIASTEYRSLDMTWLSWEIPLGPLGAFSLLYVVDFLTHTTVFLELFYCCLVWNRWTRPWVLLGAIGMHVFIGSAMGMITFGLIMIFGNLSFFSPTSIQRFCDPVARRISLAIVGEAAPNAG